MGGRNRSHSVGGNTPQVLIESSWKKPTASMGGAPSIGGRRLSTRNAVPALPSWAVARAAAHESSARRRTQARIASRGESGETFASGGGFQISAAIWAVQSRSSVLWRHWQRPRRRPSMPPGVKMVRNVFQASSFPGTSCHRLHSSRWSTPSRQRGLTPRCRRSELPAISRGSQR